MDAFLSNRDPDYDGATASNAAALCSAAPGRPDRPDAVPQGTACKRGLRDHPNCGNRDGPDRRFAPGRRRLEDLGEQR